MRTEGPGHRAWLHIRRQMESLRSQARQFNDDLASVKENNPACADLPIQPIVDDSPDLPPEPPFEE